MTFCKFIFLSILLFTSNTFSQEKAYVVDGDTIHIGSNKYRFSGIDTPEIKQTCSKDNAIIMCGVLAKNALIHKINNHPVLCKQETIDRYKRIVAECFVNNESLSKYLVRNGYAFAYRKYSKKFIEDERYAKENKLGLWSMNFEYPWEYRRKLRSK
jgi:endonuclease YncB( thermonuclease family)